MRPAEFEEKEYEGPLYVELLMGERALSTPGQVFESHFGVDAAMHTQNPVIWDMLGMRETPPGAILDDFRWGYVWRNRGAKRPLPRFAVNLLIQSKRPTLMARATPAVRDGGVTAPHWRFELDSIQQRLLERVAQKIGHRAVVVYAAAAFDTFDALYRFADEGTLVDNSTFIRATRVSGHSKWNYDSPGARGVATSEPASIEEPTLAELLLEHRNAGGTPERNLIVLERNLVSALVEMSDSSPRATFALRTMDAIRMAPDEESPSQAATRTLLRLKLGLRSLGLEWLVAG